MKKRQPTLPTFGEIVPGEGGRLGAIMRGALVDGVRQPDYAVIVSDAAAGDIDKVEWGLYGTKIPGADSLADGRANTLAMLKAGCPAAQRISELRIGGHADWYIGSRAELWALRANVPELLEKAIYWTSTQDSSTSAFAQDFEDGGSGWYYEYYEFRVRALRAVRLQHFND